MNSLHESLDVIWDNVKPCKCGNDDNWSQDIKGSIHCDKCNEDVA
ncbi:MAG TPA: hypothetical protein VNU45_18220 [Rummeliibacillus sp.]|nr:hypothetical protein [Rummeliibacillus sp.]